jgi:AraC family transcriptional regulator
LSEPGAIGDFVAWDGGCLFIGEASGVTPVHSHYAVQLSLGSEPGVRLRTSERDGWTTYGAAAVPPRQPHAFDGTGVRYWATLFVEPETRAGHALVERYLHGGIAELPEDALAEARPALFAAWREARTVRALTDAARGVVHALTGGVEPSVVSDERILRAVAYINVRLDAPLTLEEVAAEAYLSPSRFRHLFAEETGMGLRPYVLWRRFLRAWALVMAGESLTAAAHGAGFADAAHLSRTSRQMFGFPPSLMPMAGSLRAE